jgi:hypothetical protein
VDEAKTRQTTKVFETLKSCLDKKECKYDEDTEKLTISAGFETDDIPARISIRVIPSIEIVHLVSPIPVKLSPDRIEEGCLAACAANDELYDGNFIVDTDDGSVLFTMSYIYNGCILGEELFSKMLSIALTMIDEYNDKFLLLQKGLLSAADFVEKPEA